MQLPVFRSSWEPCTQQAQVSLDGQAGVIDRQGNLRLQAHIDGFMMILIE